MKDQLFIPDKIKCGFQSRSDTYTNKLAYIIYYDAKGVLRKEKSFESWRDKKIPTIEIDNKPFSGFTLNKDVKRSSEWFSDGRNMIRVYDERGLEFEITTGNLLFILMTTDCLRRGLQGEFVYGWSGTELILLPTDCLEYKNSVSFSSLQGKKFSAKSLIPGCYYKTKNQKEHYYLGKFNWWESSFTSGNESYVFSKKFVFIDNSGKPEAFSSLTKFAEQITDTPDSDYANKMDVFLNSLHSSKVVDFELRDAKPFKINVSKIEKSNAYYLDAELLYTWRKSNGIVTRTAINTGKQYDKTSGKSEWTRKYAKTDDKEISLLENGMQIKRLAYVSSYQMHYSDAKYYTYSIEDIESISPKELYFKLENGKIIKYNNQ